MFFLDVVRQMHLPTRMESADRDLLFQADLGLRRQLGVSEGAFEDWNRRTRDLIKKNVVYRITDEFSCKYIAFFLEWDEKNVPKVVLIGPYVTEELDRVWLERFCQRMGIHRDWIPVLESYFQKISFLRDESLLFAAITALGNRLWGEDGFTTESVISGVPENWIPLATSPEQRQTEVVEDIQLVEARYNSENRLIEAVSQGQSRKAELMLAHTSQSNLEQRTPEKIRNTKNYTIILNTLLRKAAEQGGVHPLYIDRLSSEFARRIEKLTRQDDISAFWQEMAHRYCLLVKKYSLKMYSPLIQKVISRVEFDLAGDLSLHSGAGVGRGYTRHLRPRIFTGTHLRGGGNRGGDTAWRYGSYSCSCAERISLRPFLLRGIPTTKEGAHEAFAGTCPGEPLDNLLRVALPRCEVPGAAWRNFWSRAQGIGFA